MAVKAKSMHSNMIFPLTVKPYKLIVVSPAKKATTIKGLIIFWVNLIDNNLFANININVVSTIMRANQAIAAPNAPYAEIRNHNKKIKNGNSIK